MIENPDFEKIRLISKKAWSGFELHEGENVFVLKPKHYQYITVFFLLIQLITSLYRYITNGEELFMVVFIIACFLVYFTLLTLKKTARNKVTFNLRKELIEIKNLNFIAGLFNKPLFTTFEKVDSVHGEITKSITRIYVIVEGKKHKILEVRNRRSAEENTIDSVSDGEIAIECLDSILMKNN